MKPIEIMNSTNSKISNSLKEVWDWKEAVYEDTKNMDSEQLNKYFFEGLLSAVKSLNAKLVKNKDGSYNII